LDTIARMTAGYWRTAARFTGSTWREMFDPRSLPQNLSAGITVAMVAVPLNLALAIACGLPPAVGLATGAIAGIVAALLGGSRLQVTGPEVALVPVTFEIVSRFGFTGLIVATAIAGVLQIAFGALRLGRLVNVIPAPVLGGFLAAVGLMVLDSQLPRLLDLPDVRVLSGIRDPGVLAHANPLTIGLGALVIGTVLLMPRLAPRAPAPLIALLVAVAAFVGFGWSIPTVAPIEQAGIGLAWPPFADVDLMALLPDAIVLALVASIDSLLCAVAIEPQQARRNADQELVAQGLANLTSACIGGMPVAAAVVRSRAALDAGATTRLTPVLQCVVLGLVLFVLSPLVAYVPLVSLAAILLVVGCRLIDARQLFGLWRVDRFEASMFVITAVGILATDFVMGVLIGVMAALAGFAHEQGKRLRIQVAHVQGNTLAASELRGIDSDIAIIRLRGPLFFGNIDRLDGVLAAAESTPYVVFDLARVYSMDASGALALVLGVERLSKKNVRVWLTEPRAAARPALEAAFEQHPVPAVRRAESADAWLEPQLLDGIEPGAGRDAVRGAERDTRSAPWPVRRPSLDGAAAD